MCSVIMQAKTPVQEAYELEGTEWVGCPDMSAYDRKNEKYPVLPIEHAVANKGPFEMTLEPDSP